MAYDELLADRIRNILRRKQVPNLEKKMMGGLCFMVDDKMCVGIVKNELMARIDPEIYEEALTKNSAHEMNFTGRPMKGFLFVEPEGVDMDHDLEYWVDLCLDFNPRAKSSKKSKNK
jgi:TfoX/Sxy family transcriptional regulator of competence genes